MNTRAAEQLLRAVEAEAHSRPSPIEFEMAYQAHVAADRIRFAISQLESASPNTGQLREASIQLLDALDRLEALDHKFQIRSRHGSPPSDHSAHSELGLGRGLSSKPSHSGR